MNGAPLRPIVVRGMWGLGDCIYQRPFIRSLVDSWSVYLETPWPELYADLPVRFVRGDRALRTQRKNIATQRESLWAKPPAGAYELKIGYGHALLARFSIIGAMRFMFRCQESPPWDLPDLGPAPVSSSKPIALVRPVTIRREWCNPARNPRADYVRQAAAHLQASGYYVVCVADLQDGEEWLDGPRPVADRYAMRGELSVRPMLALARDSAIIAGGVGWIVPAAIALGTPCVIIQGGHGGHNAPEKIIDPGMAADHIAFIGPERLCRCTNMRHGCDKTIPDLRKKFASAVHGFAARSNRALASIA